MARSSTPACRPIAIGRHADGVAPRGWDELVADTPGTDVTQLSAWARVRAAQGFTAVHLLAGDTGRPAGGAQVLVRAVPGLGRLGYLPYGPLVHPHAPDRGAVVAALGAALTALGGELRMLFVQPPEGAEDVMADLLCRGFRESAADTAPRGSCRIDLARDLADIRRGMSRRLRYWTGRWEARGVGVRRGNAADLPLLADLARTTALAHGYRPPDPAAIEALFRELAPDHAAIFVGEWHGRPVTADLVTMCGGLVRGRIGGFDRSGDGARLSVPAAARWTILQWARDAGYRWLDFGGLADATVRAVLAGVRDDPAWPGADRSKLAFGAEVFAYPAPVELVRPAGVRLAYDLLTRTATGRDLLGRAKAALRTSAPARPRRARP